ncbi:MAG: NAD(P)H-binding protein [Alphaproteobacteria bacterium]
MLGATGTIGRPTVRALRDRGYHIVCFVRSHRNGSPYLSDHDTQRDDDGIEYRFGDVTDLMSIKRDGLRGEQFDCVVSCLASRTGAPNDAWAIDYQAHSQLLQVAKEAGVKQFIMLSALCVQKPRLAFQEAKLAFEKELIGSGLTYSIIRPTAFFKSLSGQVDRVKQGKSFLIFGNGRLTACKPISDRDLADYIAQCLEDETRWNRILPIGGPGPAITPRDQGDYLFSRLNHVPKFKSVPLALMTLIIGVLSFIGRLHKGIAEKAELAKIGYYYATESMLVLNPETGLYDAALTPSTGSDTLFEHYDRLLADEIQHERGDHSVF